MILVDTDVWSRHLRERDERLVKILADSRVVLHSWVIGELSLGPGIRLDVLDDLRALPCVPSVSDDELFAFIMLHRLRGIGWVDAQLLVASLVATVELWTADGNLRDLARRFEIDAGI